jgi:hypothetical protein
MNSGVAGNVLEMFGRLRHLKQHECTVPKQWFHTALHMPDVGVQISQPNKRLWKPHRSQSDGAWAAVDEPCNVGLVARVGSFSRQPPIGRGL